MSICHYNSYRVPTCFTRGLFCLSSIYSLLVDLIPTLRLRYLLFRAVSYPSSAPDKGLQNALPGAGEKKPSPGAALGPVSFPQVQRVHNRAGAVREL